MNENLKLNIIYYEIPSDFELEFNLCGCCQARLLTDNASGANMFVHSLSKAVSRSRIIICVGKIFGDDGLINIISKAVGIPLEELDNSKYSVNSTESINIIKGSLPLIIDGTFGGCIIESGPQSIIVLTGNNDLRKSIMNNLVHKYIAAVSNTPLNTVATDSIPSDETTEDLSSDNAEISEEIDIPNEENPPEEDLENQDETIPENVSDVESVTDESDSQKSNEANTPLEDNTYTEQESSDADEEQSVQNIEIVFTNAEDNSKSVADNEQFIMFDEDDDYDESNLTSSVNDGKNNTFVTSIESENVFDEIVMETEETHKSKSKKNKTKKKKSKLSIAILILSIILLFLCGLISYYFIYIPLSNGTSIVENFTEFIRLLNI